MILLDNVTKGIHIVHNVRTKTYSICMDDDCDLLVIRVNEDLYSSLFSRKLGAIKKQTSRSALEWNYPFKYLHESERLPFCESWVDAIEWFYNPEVKYYLSNIQVYKGMDQMTSDSMIAGFNRYLFIRCASETIDLGEDPLITVFCNCRSTVKDLMEMLIQGWHLENTKFLRDMKEHFYGRIAMCRYIRSYV